MNDGLGQVLDYLRERGLADVQVQLAEFSVRLDRFGAHVERIERRLDLVEGPAA